ncbi:MAG: hypothetical protein IT379_27445 [Deltaproteobacteria bacterium]|nr:hypothetical protein [Deltaproteobacteria bacterium]
MCGCDGNTYGNACEAASRGVDVATRGECGSTSLSCIDTRCEDGLTCIGGPSCGGTWSCAALGRLCTDDLVPYCACNGTTFEDSSTCPSLAYAWMGTCERPLGLVSCDRIEVFCRRVEPTCPAGQAPSVLGTCWGPCVPIEQCRCTPGEIRDTCPRGAMGCGPEGHCLP